MSADRLPYLAQQLPKALERSLDGLNRVAEIVRSMRELAHPDRPEMSEVDLNHVIRNALVVARAEYKYVAEVRDRPGAAAAGALPCGRIEPGDAQSCWSTHRMRSPMWWPAAATRE